jgi:hypothetical protein
VGLDLLDASKEQLLRIFSLTRLVRQPDLSVIVMSAPSLIIAQDLLSQRLDINKKR